MENRRLKEEAFSLRDDKHKLKRAMKKMARENDRLRESQLSAYDRSDKLVELTKSLIVGGNGGGSGGSGGSEDVDGRRDDGYGDVSGVGSSFRRHQRSTDMNSSRHRRRQHHPHGSGTDGGRDPQYHHESSSKQKAAAAANAAADLEQENRVLRQQLKSLLRSDSGGRVGRW